MFRVTYTIEDVDGSLSEQTREFEDTTMVESEQTFQPGRKLLSGAVIKSVSVSKVKKVYYTAKRGSAPNSKGNKV